MCIIIISVLSALCRFQDSGALLVLISPPISVESCPHQLLPKVLSKAPPSPDKTYSTIAQFSVFLGLQMSFFRLRPRGYFQHPFPLVKFISIQVPFSKFVMTLFSLEKPDVQIQPSRIKRSKKPSQVVQVSLLFNLINSSLLYGKLQKKTAQISKSLSPTVVQWHLQQSK